MEPPSMRERAAKRRVNAARIICTGASGAHLGIFRLVHDLIYGAA